MFCPHCGKQIQEQAKFCPFCGKAAQNAMLSTAAPPYAQNQGPAGGPLYAQNQSPAGGPSYAQNQSPAGGLPMRWYKFIIYFQLFAAGFINIVMGFGTMMGLHYQGMADSVYLFFPGMRAADIVMGIAQVVLGIWALVVRQMLHDYNTRGPAMFTAFQAASIAASTLYLAAGAVLVGPAVINAQSVPSIIATGIMLACNVVYFRKRAFLFNR